ncbi:MAG: polyphosphate polymerase domain-containing protein [Chthoniobacterales bacterium]
MILPRLDRYELKFLIKQEEKSRLLDEMSACLRPDMTGGSSFYPIVSLYYDTPQRDFYWEKHEGLRSRRKVRVRVYGSEDSGIPPTTFIEVKHKHEGRGVKRRAQLPLESAMAIGRGEMPDCNLSYGEQKVAREVVSMVQNRQIAPVCVLRYERQAFAGLEDETGLRVTFDTGITYRMNELEPVPDDRRFTQRILDDDHAIMEVKVWGVVPYWLSVVLGRHGCMARSFSKYCSALEASDPVLQQQRSPLRAARTPLAPGLSLPNLS